MNPRLKILVAGGDGETGKLAGLLSEFGCEVIHARDALHATSAVLKNKPDAVVLNGQLPAGGAVLVLKRVRASVHTANTPVMAITGRRQGDAEELRLHGADECLPPPPDAVAIMAWIRKRLGGRPELLEAPRAIIRETERLDALARTRLLDTPPSESFDTLTALSAHLLRVPVSLVSLVAEGRQFFKSQSGLPEPWATSRETPLTHSFCQWVVSGHEDLIISDAREHSVLSSNLAIAELGVVAYAGIPLAATSGDCIGAFCAIDTSPRAWSDLDVALLRDLSRMAEACIAVSESATARKPGEGSAEARGIARSLLMGAIGGGITTASDILQRDDPRLGEPQRKTLLKLVEWLGQHIVRLAGT
jgi:DNA-binding response OmpR family regulator